MKIKGRKFSNFYEPVSKQNIVKFSFYKTFKCFRQFRK